MITRSGVVVSCQIWSETHVSGGSASRTSYIGPAGGHVTSPDVSITSTTAEKLQVFIREDDGREFDQRFVNPGVGLREGHRVSIVYVPDENGQPLALVNHTTGKSRIYDNRVGALLGRPPSPLLLRLVTPAYMIALLPLHILTYYLGFTGHMDHLQGMMGPMGGFVEWVLWNVLLIAGMWVLPLFGGKTPKGLREAVVEALRRRVDGLLADSRPPAATA